MRETLNQLLPARPPAVDRVARDVDRDYIMSAEQAMELRDDRSRHIEPRTGSDPVSKV